MGAVKPHAPSDGPTPPTAEALNHVVQPPGNAQGERAARVQAREHSP